MCHKHVMDKFGVAFRSLLLTIFRVTDEHALSPPVVGLSVHSDVALLFDVEIRFAYWTRGIQGWIIGFSVQCARDALDTQPVTVSFFHPYSSCQ